MKHEKHGSAVTLNTNVRVPIYHHKLFLPFPWHQDFDDHSALNAPTSFNQNFSKMSETSQSVLCVGLGAFLWEWASGYFLLTPLEENLRNHSLLPVKELRQEKKSPVRPDPSSDAEDMKQSGFTDSGAEAHHWFRWVCRQGNSHHVLDHFGF